MRDKRTLSKKAVNIYRRRRYALIPAVRDAALRRARCNYKYKREPEVFNFDGEQYVLLSKACEILNIRPHTFRRLQQHGIIPDLPKHPNGWRYIIRLSNVELLKFAMQQLPHLDSEANLTVPMLRDIREFVLKYWNSKCDYLTSQITL